MAGTLPKILRDLNPKNSETTAVIDKMKKVVNKEVASMKKPSDHFKTKKDFNAHKRNLKAVSDRIREMGQEKGLTSEEVVPYKKELFDRIVAHVESYKPCKGGYVVTLNIGVRVKVWSLISQIPEPIINEDVILTINDRVFSPIYWSNCNYKSFDSRANISANIIGYKPFIKRWFGVKLK